MQATLAKTENIIAIEAWPTVCVVAATGTQSLVLELWDQNQRCVPFNNGGTEYSTATMNIGATAYSLPQLLVANSYTGGGTTTNGIPNPLTDGKAVQAVGGRFYNAGTAGIVVNLAGTTDGSAGAGNGIDGTAGRAPVAGGAYVVPPGSYVLFGRYIQDPS